MFYVYLVQSQRNGKYYAGLTENLVHRINEYRCVTCSALRTRSPLKLVGYQKFRNKSDAKYFEYKVRRNTKFRKEFIQSSSSDRK